jgi:hypothetical protein
LVDRKLESKIRKKFDELYDELVAADYNKNDVQEILDRLEEELVDELDDFEEEDDED